MDSLLHAEMTFAEVLAGLVGGGPVSVDSHFFEDLGADSMVMAQFCARVRKRADVPSVSMKDIYRYPTIRDLAAALVPAVAGDVQAPPVQGSAAPTPLLLPAQALLPPQEPVVAPRRASTTEYVLCGVLQFVLFLATTFLTAAVWVTGYNWISAGTGLIDIYLRSVLFGGANFLCLFALPILAKWILVGRWKPREIRIWSLGYVRFWFVKSLVQKNPLVRLMAGSPLYTLYLRALGAKIGPGVVIFSPSVPVCTDLLSIGAGTVIRKSSSLTGYRAHAGVIQTGAVTLGKGVFVGEATVLDINTSMGDGAQLGHTSALYTGQSVPAGERWHGSPAQRTDVDYRGVDPTGCGALRRTVFGALQLLTLFAVSLPVGIFGVLTLFTEIPQLAALLDTGPLDLTSWTFYVNALIASAALFFGALLVGLVLAVTVPRVLNLAITPDKVYRLYGFHYGVHRLIARRTNKKSGPMLFGDSSYIVHYLRCLGYNLSPVVQTGSNFGQAVSHENPFLSSVGSGTMVADGLSIMNAEYSSTSFRVSRTSIGRDNFLGNKISYPSQGRTGDNCLLATKVMIPIDGKVREGVGLLGSPSFEIPRTVQRDASFELENKDELRRRLAAKNKHNIVTMAMYLLVRWIHMFGVTLITSASTKLHRPFDAPAMVATGLGIFVFSVVYFVLLERATDRLQALKPLGCSIYDRAFWRHERSWKLPAEPYLKAFDGTPFKGVLLRALGVRIGKRVFDDGCAMPEKTFVTIGDECTLNVGSTVQTHSQEDGAFKSDRSSVGAGATLGVGAFVHYGVTIGEGAVLAPDSFLMKGEEVPPHAYWGGNPARELRDDVPAAVPTTPKAVPAADAVPEVAEPEVQAEVDAEPPAWLSSGAYAEAVSGGKTRWES